MQRIARKRKSAMALAGGYEEGEGMRIGWSWGWKRKSVVALAGGHEEGRRDV
jgi:hypothetical protein